MGPIVRSKGAMAYPQVGKEPVPNSQKEHIANPEQIVYIVSIVMTHGGAIWSRFPVQRASVVRLSNPGHKEHGQ